MNVQPDYPDFNSRAKTFNYIRRVRGVTSVIPVYGVYDCIVRTEADNIDDLKYTVSCKLRKIDKVTGNLDVCVVLDKQGQPIGFKKDASGKIVYENIPE